MQTKDVIIIGAGPAGMSAAIYCKRAMLDTLIIEKNAPGGMVVNTHEVENYLGHKKMSGASLAMAMYDSLNDFMVDYEYGDVLEITKEDNLFHLKTDVAEYFAKAVIYATGTVPRKFNVDGEERFSYKGISWCAICDGGFYKGEDVIVLGARNSACEEALYLASLCKTVTIVARSYLKCDKVVKEKVLACKNIKILEETDLLSFVGEDELEGILVRNKQTNEESLIKAKGVFEFIGLIPNTKVISELVDLDEEGYIIASEDCLTKTKGLYVAGDIRRKPLRQIVTAVSDGAVAANQASRYIENEF